MEMPRLELQKHLLSYKRLFGLIGYPLSHSFSKKHFTQKFAEEGISDAFYELFPLETINLFPQLVQNYPNLVGLNVTIPYKEQVLPYLDALDEGAQAIGAVNTIKVSNGKLTGYNTDAYGFEASMKTFLAEHNAQPSHALVLGTGGAAKAVVFVLTRMGMDCKIVSRDAAKGDFTYNLLDANLLEKYPLIVNTTPVGMAPHVENYPNIPYYCLSNEHLLYDLVYNPTETAFLKKGKAQGAGVANGLAMLQGQAEKAWAIWNQ